MSHVAPHAHVRARTLIASAQSAGVFGAFLDLVDAVGLSGTLCGDGPFTIFAPTDAAFLRIPQATREKVFAAAYRGRMRNVLSMHIAPGAVRSRRFEGCRMHAETIGGVILHIDGLRADGRAGIVVNAATIIMPDIGASNGVLHGIDRVIWPKRRASDATIGSA